MCRDHVERPGFVTRSHDDRVTIRTRVAQGKPEQDSDGSNGAVFWVLTA